MYVCIHTLNRNFAMQTDPTRLATLTIRVKGMSCGSCEARVHRALAAVPGFRAARIERADERAIVEYDPSIAVQAEFAAAIVAAGYSATLPPSPGASALTPPDVGPNCEGSDEPGGPDPEQPRA